MTLMHASDLFAEIASRFPLLQTLRFSAAGRSAPQPGLLPPGLGLLLSAADTARSGGFCFVFADKTNVASTVAVLVALSRLVTKLPRLVRDFAERGFTEGQRVEVLPTGHVYEYGGFFPERYGEFFRLCVVGSVEKECRSLPVTEILRLRPTLRKRPKGKAATDLREAAVGAIDRVLNIRTAGNTAVFSNEVFLLTSRADFLGFLETTEVHATGSGNQGASLLSDVVSWGSLTENGDIRPADKYQAAGEPLIVASSEAVWVADSCRKSPVASKVVVVDGAALVKNLQAFDEMVNLQPTVVVADYHDEEVLPDLRSRGCLIWKLSTNELLLGAEASVFQTAWMSSGITAARNRDRLQLGSVVVNQAGLGGIGSRLAEVATQARNTREEEHVQEAVSCLYGVLLEVGGWYGSADKLTVERCINRIKSAVDSVRRRSMWVEPSTAKTICEVAAGLQGALQDKRLGESKLERLLSLLEDESGSGRHCAVVTRTPIGAQLLARTLDEWGVNTHIFAAATVHEGAFFDHLIVAGWPRAVLFERVVRSWVAPCVTLVAYPYEEVWFQQIMRRFRGWSTGGELSLEDKAKTIGVDASLLAQLVHGDRAEAAEARSVDLGDAEAVLELERIVSNTRKGSRPIITEAMDVRLAKYVGFVGQTYAYLTETHSVPLVSALIRAGPPSHRIPLVRVDELRPGDFVLFRDQGDQDVISLIAQEIVGSDSYAQWRATAERWREVLKGLGADSRDVYERLRLYGLPVHFQTVRSWLTDPARIGPGDKEHLLTIADAAHDKNLKRAIDDVWNAVVAIRGSHIAAGSRLSDLLLHELPDRLGSPAEEETAVDLTFGRAWIVQVETVGTPYEDRTYTEVNRLLWAWR